ncbi:hypothetical protein L208DRAFT_1544816, partial [Tricholoma matsutake]
RGPVVADGKSFFIGENVWTPQIFSLIGEVNELWFNGSENASVLMLGRPALSGAVMDLFWQQQILALERIKLEDFSVDRGLRIVGRLSLQLRLMCIILMEVCSIVPMLSIGLINHMMERHGCQCMFFWITW